MMYLLVPLSICKSIKICNAKFIYEYKRRNRHNENQAFK